MFPVTATAFLICCTQILSLRGQKLHCTQNDNLILFDRTLCPSFTNLVNVRRPIYFLYDVNPSEGFNLRRDVYIRLAVFIRNLKRKKGFEDVKLVLPPFRRLYHWKSSFISQENLPWRIFFDLDSFRKFVPVIDYEDFLLETDTCVGRGEGIAINHVYQLKHFEEMFENGVFRDKFEFGDCARSDSHPGPFLQQRNLLEARFSCLKFQGSANLLEKVLQISMKREKCQDWFPKIFLFLNAEIVLHDHWGSKQFWQARRSMRFANGLVEIANAFRELHFNSTPENDLVQRPFDWRDEKAFRGANGGDYICAHLRRGDFMYGREKTTPTLKSAANQIKAKLSETNLSKVFVSSDCTQFEYKNLKAFLPRVKLLRFTTQSLGEKELIKDGGVAIVDQLICSHAKYFIGTYESTFTYRIYEEREILGFPKATTFNTFCKQDNFSNCSKNSVWPIVF